MTFKFTFPATFFQQLTSTPCVSRSVSELHVPVHNAIIVMSIITGLFFRFVLLRGRRLWECFRVDMNGNKSENCILKHSLRTSTCKWTIFRGGGTVTVGNFIECNVMKILQFLMLL